MENMESKSIEVEVCKNCIEKEKTIAELLDELKAVKFKQLLGMVKRRKGSYRCVEDEDSVTCRFLQAEFSDFETVDLDMFCGMVRQFSNYKLDVNHDYGDGSARVSVSIYDLFAEEE